jgi:hypothetical protein
MTKVQPLLRIAIEDWDGVKVIADYGAGIRDTGVKLAARHGKTFLRYDPRLPDSVNQEFFAGVWEADLVTCTNVLGTIKDEDELDHAIDSLLFFSDRAKVGCIITVGRCPDARNLLWYSSRIRSRTGRSVDVLGGRIYIYNKGAP